MAHQADGGLVHHLVQDHEVLVLEAVFGTLEVVVQVVLQLGSLLIDVREVDEEPRAHVPLRRLHLVRAGRPVALAEQVAVLEETPAPDLFWIPGGDQLFVEVVERFVEVSVHALAHHGRVEVLRDGCVRAALVEEEEGVEHDVERVD